MYFRSSDHKQTAAFQHSSAYNQYIVYIIIVWTTAKILLPSSVPYCYGHCVNTGLYNGGSVYCGTTCNIVIMVSSASFVLSRSNLIISVSQLNEMPLIGHSDISSPLYTL